MLNLFDRVGDWLDVIIEAPAFLFWNARGEGEPLAEDILLMTSLNADSPSALLQLSLGNSKCFTAK